MFLFFCSLLKKGTGKFLYSARFVRRTLFSFDVNVRAKREHKSFLVLFFKKEQQLQ